MSSKRSFLLLLFTSIGVWQAFCHFAAAQESAQEKLDWVLDTASEELQNLIRSEYDLEIDFLKRKFDLEDDDLLKLRIYAKSVARNQWRSFEESFRKRLGERLEKLDGSTLSINDKRFTFEGEESEAKLFIEIQLHRREEWGVLKMSGANISKVGAFQSDRAEVLTFRDTAKYRNSLSAFSNQKQEEFQQARINLREESLFQAAVVLVADRLYLDPDQKAELETWIRSKLAEDEDSLNKYLDEDLYSQAGALVTDKIRKFEAPSFFNDVQKRGWRLFQNSPYPLGW